MGVELSGVEKRFGETQALAPINLVINDGELLALLGPSGSGKTTLLRIIAGLERASAGRILLDGRDATALAPAARGVGFVFQHYALFRHMTVFENVAFGLRVQRRGRRPDEAAICRRVGDLLSLMRLNDLGRRFPGEISGGQRQRVALARALAVEPKLLLLDEPFGALDAAVRHELRAWLGELHDRLGLTTVFVTHDQTEAFEIGHRIALLNQGRIEQIGSPAELYDRPANPFVMEFLGRANRIACIVRCGQIHAEAGWDLSAAQAELSEGPATAYVRPEDILIGASAERSGGAKIEQVVVLGSRCRLVVACGNERVEAELARDEVPVGLTPGVSVHVVFRRYRLFPVRGWPTVSAKVPARQPVAVLS
jgi:sulfate/thiosulfate transport system ATP-binding protein